MKGFNLLVAAKRDGLDFSEKDYSKVYAAGVSLNDYKMMTQFFNLTIDPKAFQVVGKCNDLKLIVKTGESLLEKLEKYTEALDFRSKHIGKQIISKDVKADLERLVAEAKKQIVESQSFIIDLLSQIATKQVGIEQRKAREKASLQNVPRMGKGKRRTLKWYRAQARKESEERGKEKEAS